MAPNRRNARLDAASPGYRPRLTTNPTDVPTYFSYASFRCGMFL